MAALRRLADQLEALQVGNARAQGWSWDAIGALLGVSKQAVHKKHARTARAARAARAAGAAGTTATPATAPKARPDGRSAGQED